jgi:Ca-activated chloride channel family protein
MRTLCLSIFPAILLAAAAPAAFGQAGDLRVEIYRPATDTLLAGWETSVEVEGGASVFGGVRYLDLFLVLDTSKSLLITDPKDKRTAGAIGLVENLSASSDIRVGVIDFDRNAELRSPLTADRAGVIEALGGLDREGSTNLAAGIEAALKGFERGARADSSRVVLLFTDGKSNEKKARRAAEEARARGVAVHTLLLGSDLKGEAILQEIAETTGASFVHVTDPERLPEAFLSLRTTGVDRVTLRVPGADPIPARLVGGRFRGNVPLRRGANRIVATATSLAGETREVAVTVTVSGPLSVSIDSPFDGTLLTEHEREVAVEGEVNARASLSPEFLADHPNRGAQSVVLSVNDSPPFATTLAGGRFRGRVLLHEGPNRIVATATGPGGRTSADEVTVTVRSPGCAALEVDAVSDGRRALSISDRAVEILFDASNSMWGQIDGRAKISVAKEILEGALDRLPRDLGLALRVYGHQHGRELRDCTDSELLVPFGSGGRGPIREAIASFRPRGQTPLAYSLEQVARDFGALGGERAVVLVTDGIESCGGDPAGAARALGEGQGIPVHVIGFGLGGEVDADPASLRAIADASGGRFLTARSAEELREALAVTVGTPFRVWRGDVAVGDGALGADEVLLLPAGDYRVRVASSPPHEVAVTLSGEQGTTLTFERSGGAVSHHLRRASLDYARCEAGARAVRRQRPRRDATSRVPASPEPRDD